MQNDINGVFKWTETWGMKFNTVKCVQMTVTNKRRPILNQYYLNEEVLKKKDMIKYLGVLIDDKLTFREHIQEKMLQLYSTC